MFDRTQPKKGWDVWEPRVPDIYDIKLQQIYKLTIYNSFNPRDESIIHIKMDCEDTEKEAATDSDDDILNINIIIEICLLDENMMPEYYGLLYNNFNDNYIVYYIGENIITRKIRSIEKSYCREDAAMRQMKNARGDI